jgi:hypothetical protein
VSVNTTSNNNNNNIIQINSSFLRKSSKLGGMGSKGESRGKTNLNYSQFSVPPPSAAISTISNEPTDSKFSKLV